MPDKFDKNLSAWMQSKVLFEARWMMGNALCGKYFILHCRPYSNSMPVFNKQQQDLPQSVGH